LVFSLIVEFYKTKGVVKNEKDVQKNFEEIGGDSVTNLSDCCSTAQLQVG
jgi:hypothetical protein